MRRKIIILLCLILSLCNYITVSATILDGSYVVSKEEVIKKKSEKDLKDMTNDVLVSLINNDDYEKIMSETLENIEFETIQQLKHTGAYMVRFRTVEEANIAGISLVLCKLQNGNII